MMNLGQPFILDIPLISKGIRELVNGESAYYESTHKVNNESFKINNDDEYYNNYRMQTADESNEILESARNESQRMLEECEKKIDELFTVAMERGYSQGLINANTECEIFKRDTFNNYNTELAKLEKIFNDRISKFEENIVDFSIDIAGKVIDFEFKRNDDALRSVISKGLEQIRVKEGLCIKSSTNNCRIIENMDIIKNEEIKVMPVDVWSNEKMTIESVLGSVNIGWESQLEKIAYALSGDM